MLFLKGSGQLSAALQIAGFGGNPQRQQEHGWRLCGLAYLVGTGWHIAHH
jgi:hypothetical protein